MTYVDGFLLAMPDQHLRPVVDLLLKKYVKKQSGRLPEGLRVVINRLGFGMSNKLSE